jgi:serine/threonine protein kinase
MCAVYVNKQLFTLCVLCMSIDNLLLDFVFHEIFLIMLCRTLNVTIVNFSLSKLLISDDELLRDQRGSLAYVSPDVLSGMSMLLIFIIFAINEFSIL